MSPFLPWGDFHASLRFACSTIPEEKWGTTRSLIPKDWWKPGKRNKKYILRVNWQASIYFPMPHQSGAPFANVQSFPKEQWYRAGVFFLPFPSPLSFFRPCTYRKGYYFYSPHSSTVIISKMVATTILRTRTRFRPPKIRLHCRLFKVDRLQIILVLMTLNLAT